MATQICRQVQDHASTRGFAGGNHPLKGRWNSSQNGPWASEKCESFFRKIVKICYFCGPILGPESGPKIGSTNIICIIGGPILGPFFGPRIGPRKKRPFPRLFRNFLREIGYFARSKQLGNGINILLVWWRLATTQNFCSRRWRQGSLPPCACDIIIFVGSCGPEWSQWLQLWMKSKAQQCI